MSDVRPYGVTQNPDAAMVTANELVGTHVGSVIGNATVVGAGPATLSTAPYVPPNPHPGPKGCWAKHGSCGAPALKGERFCVFHQPKGSE